MIYSTSLDKTTKIITILVTLLFIVICSFQFFIPQRTMTILMPIGLVAIYFLILVFRPLRYEISDGLLLIHRPISKVKIPISSIKDVSAVDRTDLGFLFRTFGVGGFFGYFGSFSSTKLGSMTLYTTRRNKLVVVYASNSILALTPDEPEQFAADLSKLTKV